MEWLQANYVVVITFLFLLSEALAVFPVVKANGIFQLVASFLKWLKEKFTTATK